MNRWPVDAAGLTTGPRSRSYLMRITHHTFRRRARFLFEWLGWTPQPVTTFKGPMSTVYLENLAPTFYIDQDEGWTGLQALQISRYGQQQISEIAVEYLLGARDAAQARVTHLQAVARDFGLRDAARDIETRVQTLFVRNGWAVDWTGHGSIGDILPRWEGQSLKDALKREAKVDLADQRLLLEKRAESLRRTLTVDPIDTANVSAPAAASQRVIELKTQRHQLNDDVRTLRTQHAQTVELLDSITHRIHAAADLVRLKESGVGRLDHMECPTCHRDLDLETFSLRVQGVGSVKAHIEALRRDREMVQKNLEAIAAARTAAQAELARVDADFRDAESALQTVTASVGTVREQIAQTASDLTAVERRIDRLAAVVTEINDLQSEVDRWVVEARATRAPLIALTEEDPRRRAFIEALRDYVLAFGHSAVSRNNVSALALDEQYAPQLDGRRLRSLGSASDRARLVAAYSLALAAASRRVGGLHPGVVILDEPLQQNPDETHRDLFISFLAQQLARQADFQTVIFTWLSADEIDRLRGSGTNVIAPEGEHFLRREAPPPVVAPSVPTSTTKA